VDVAEAGTVARGQVEVASRDGISAGKLTVLLVHVVGAASRVVADPDTKVLDGLGLLLKDLVISLFLTRAFF